MNYEIIWTRRALRRLDEIGAYIAHENPVAAAKVVGRITAATERLADYPQSGRPGRLNNTREIVLADFPDIVPYRVIGDRVHIITVLHAAQKWPFKR
jgi:addiction module RelE/StbE family toxin